MAESDQIIYRPEPRARPNFCELGMTPLLMTGFLIQILRQHFSDAALIEDPALRHVLYGGEAKRGMVIESATRWVAPLSDERPAIVVKRNSWQIRRLGINNELQGIFRLDGARDFETLRTGSHSIFCIAREGAEVERLAEEVANEIIQFGPELERYLDLKRFELATHDQVHQLRDAPGGFAVPLVVAYAASRTWTIRSERPRLREISLKTLLDS